MRFLFTSNNHNLLGNFIMKKGEKMKQKVLSSFILINMMTACGIATSSYLLNESTPTYLTSPTIMVSSIPVRTFALVVKNLDDSFFDIANMGAQEAAKELDVNVIYIGPTKPDATLQAQLIDSLIAQKVNGLAISADDEDALVTVGKTAIGAGIPVISWDGIIAKEGRILHIIPWEIKGMGEIPIEIASEIASPNGGDIAIIFPTSPACCSNWWFATMQEALKKPEYAMLHLVEGVYGEDDYTKSYNEALGLIDKYPNLKVIIVPATNGIVAAARAVTDRGLIGKLFVTGYGFPSKMREYVESGVVPEFALWNPADMGYLTIYTLNALVTKQITGKEGDTYSAGRLGKYTVRDDPTMGPNILLGLPFIWNKDNIDEPYSQF